MAGFVQPKRRNGDEVVTTPTLLLSVGESPEICRAAANAVFEDDMELLIYNHDVKE